MMLAVSLAVAALALESLPQTFASQGVQATKTVCRPFASSAHHSAPICRGGGPLEAQPACFCRGPDVRFDEPGCWPDGSPAILPGGRSLTPRENDRLISCVDWQRQQDRRR